VEVDVDHAPRGQVVLVDEATDLHDPGVVDQHVERSQLLLGSVQEGREGVAVGHVQRQGHRARAELRSGRTCGLEVHVADRHLHAVAQERFGGRTSDPACGARDGGCLSCEDAGLLCHWSLLGALGMKSPAKLALRRGRRATGW
jgi:hypothetical protein